MHRDHDIPNGHHDDQTGEDHGDTDHTTPAREHKASGTSVYTSGKSGTRGGQDVHTVSCDHYDDRTCNNCEDTVCTAPAHGYPASGTPARAHNHNKTHCSRDTLATCCAGVAMIELVVSTTQ